MMRNTNRLRMAQPSSLVHWDFPFVWADLHDRRGREPQCECQWLNIPICHGTLTDSPCGHMVDCRGRSAAKRIPFAVMKYPALVNL